jgi:hypothetical protein
MRGQDMVNKAQQKWLVPGIIIGGLIFFSGIMEIISLIAMSYVGNKSYFDLTFFFWLVITFISGTIFLLSFKSYSFHNRKLEIEHDLAKHSEKQAQSLPKIYSYYCNSCLFQTNNYSKRCPKCRMGNLENVS